MDSGSRHPNNFSSTNMKYEVAVSIGLGHIAWVKVSFHFDLYPSIKIFNTDLKSTLTGGETALSGR